MSGAKRAPEHLRVSTRAWWRAVVASYELEEHHRRILTLAGEAHDRCAEAREAIAEHGPYFMDRFEQPKAHPALAVERDSRLAFARLLRELNLDAGAASRERRAGGEPDPYARFAELDAVERVGDDRA